MPTVKKWMRKGIAFVYPLDNQTIESNVSAVSVYSFGENWFWNEGDKAKPIKSACGPLPVFRSN